MDCFVVCVGYWDYLSLTLPRMKRWFDDVTVITSPAEAERFHDHTAALYVTDAFYREGAVFNKGAAMEEAMADANPTEWICVMDADILLPSPEEMLLHIEPGNIYGPHRRQQPEGADYADESEWQYLLLGNDPITQCPGFMQVFHASDPILATRPWYPVNWRHGGGCDSDFCEKWPKAKQRRLPFDVLHLGQPRKNWCGRATPHLDGTVPKNAAENAKAYEDMIAQRQRYGLKLERLPRKGRNVKE